MSDCCGCHADDQRAASDPAYRRALWLVVVLNLVIALLFLHSACEIICDALGGLREARSD